MPVCQRDPPPEGRTASGLFNPQKRPGDSYGPSPVRAGGPQEMHICRNSNRYPKVPGVRPPERPVPPEAVPVKAVCVCVFSVLSFQRGQGSGGRSGGIWLFVFLELLFPPQRGKPKVRERNDGCNFLCFGKLLSQSGCWDQRRPAFFSISALTFKGKPNRLMNPAASAWL